MKGKTMAAKSIPQRLSEDQITTALAALDGWSRSGAGDAIDKTFEFADFGAAFAFMTRSALAAEKMDHHPDWRNVWNKVVVTLSTHDAGGVTERDITQAAAMNKFAGG